MQGNLHVPFLGGWAGAIPPGYPASPGDRLLYQLTDLPATLIRASVICYASLSSLQATNTVGYIPFNRLGH
jgi:hypothetical protein